MIRHILQEDVGVGGVVRHAVVPQRRVPLLDQQVPLLDQPFHHHHLLVPLLPGKSGRDRRFETDYAFLKYDTFRIG